MQLELPPELKEAVNLLARFEKEKDHSLRTRDFEDAIDILNDHLLDEPESPHKSFVEKIKLTYTRKLLEELPNMSGADIEIWFDYVRLFLLKVSKEVETNTEKDAQLRQNYKDFIGIWKDKVIRLLS